MSKMTPEEAKFLAAKAQSAAIKNKILDPEEAQFIDGGPIDEKGLPIDAKNYGDQIEDPYLKTNSDPLFG